MGQPSVKLLRREYRKVLEAYDTYAEARERLPANSPELTALWKAYEAKCLEYSELRSLL